MRGRYATALLHERPRASRVRMALAFLFLSGQTIVQRATDNATGKHRCNWPERTPRAAPSRSRSLCSVNSRLLSDAGESLSLGPCSAKYAAFSRGDDEEWQCTHIVQARRISARCAVGASDGSRAMARQADQASLMLLNCVVWSDLI